MKQKQKAMESPTPSDLEVPSEDAGSQHLEEVEGEAEQPRRSQRREWRIPPSNSNDFRIELPEFEGKLNPDEFLDWLHTAERIFEYKDILEDKKLK